MRIFMIALSGAPSIGPIQGIEENDGASVRPAGECIRAGRRCPRYSSRPAFIQHFRVVPRSEVAILRLRSTGRPHLTEMTGR